MNGTCYAWALLAFLVASCAGNKAGTAESPVPDHSASIAKTSQKFVDLKEIMTAMQEGPVRYSLDKDSTAYTELKLFSSEARKSNPDWYVVQDSSGSVQLSAFRNNACAQGHSEKALAAMDVKDYALSLREYVAAYGCDPQNHKLLTYIGNIFFMQEQLDSAVAYLSLSLQKNPHDYQAHYFIADAYARKGDKVKARAHLVKALMYNGRNPNILGFANNVLEFMGESIDYNRLNFGFRVTQADTAVLIRTSNDDHVIMGMCFAGLQYDPAFEDFRKQDDEIFQNRLRSCLAAQITYAQYQLDQGKLIDAQSQYLIDVLKDGYLQAMIYWEMGANLYPQILYILPAEERQNAESYISKYVIRKKI